MGSVRPTLKDVAAAADVSFKTVSRVINGERGVSEVLTDRVNAAIADLGYRPDHRARDLRRGSAVPATIGFVHAEMANPFFAAVQRGLEREAELHDCVILTGGSNGNVARQEALVTAFAARRVDGLVVVPSADTSPETCPALASELKRGTPVVFVDREPDFSTDLVLSDHRGGAAAATAHLMGQGHTDIALIGTDSFAGRERSKGYLDAHDNAGLKPFVRVTDVRTPEEAEKAVGELLDGPLETTPTAFFIAKNELTPGAVKALHARQVQHDIALVGFDDLAMADLIEPGISVVAQAEEQLGRTAGELLFTRLSGGRSEIERRVLPLRLIERGSGEIPPAATKHRGVVAGH